jgi:hypothetical protein
MLVLNETMPQRDNMRNKNKKRDKILGQELD